jgi:glycolate oxidase FAD binding subunit
MPDPTSRPDTIEAVQAAVCRYPGARLLPVGARSKPPLSALAEGVTLLEVGALSGVTQYEPDEFTFTALAGTPAREVAALLAEHGQYMPFDPLLIAHGATLGGTVAAGASGPGRYRYGGVRDFILGARYVDGAGLVIGAGGKVVKNAAGFDLPKLMTGSLGQFGVLVEVTFKVFPRPEAHATLQLDSPDMRAALESLAKLQSSPLDVEAIELVPGVRHASVIIRIGGVAATLPGRIDRLRALLGGGEAVHGPLEEAFWDEAGELAWAPTGWHLVKAPLTPARIPSLEAALAASPAVRRYSAGGQAAWIAVDGPLDELDRLLSANGLAGLVFLGPGDGTGRVRIGTRAGAAFEQRVRRALDPSHRFVEV